MSHPPVTPFAPMSPSDRNALVASARALKRAALAGSTRPLLRGKNIGLLCEAQDSDDADLFRRAATELGARVARIRPSASGLLNATEVQHTARMLGRLYDAIECQGLPEELVQQVRDDAGVPVYDAIAGAGHPSAALAAMVDDEGDNRRYVVQALLISTISQA
ncbi:ornithine carbamoyltransferase [Piscinibacter sp.]|uniref:ornithine carbamoyltransferase n=1 Tax=Piscinibacter sp. TaxID=1903157 RepID=UPI002F400B32